MSRTCLILLCLFLLAFLSVGAQTPVMQHWTQADGLPSNMVFDIAQDRNGHIWLGHDKGLSRFDGKDFITYTHPSMNGSAVSNVFEDSVGRIWCQNFIGQLFHVTDGVMVPEERIPVSGNYAPMVMDPSGHIVTGVGRQVTFYRQADLRPVSMFSTADDIFVMQVVDSSMWLMTERSLTELNGQVPKRVFIMDGLPAYSAYLFASLRGGIYAFPKRNEGGMVYQMLPEKRPIRLLPPDVVVQSVEVFGDSMIWVGTTGGLYVIDAALRVINPDRPMLSGRSVSDVMQDRDGAYWVSTTDRGIFRIADLNVLEWRLDDGVFTVFAHRDDGPDILVGTETGDVFRLNNAIGGELEPYISSKARHRVGVIHRHHGAGITLVASDRLYVHARGRGPVVRFGAVKDILRTPDDVFVLAMTGALKTLHADRTQDDWGNVELVSSVFRSTALEQRKVEGTVQVATSIGISQLSRDDMSQAVILNKDVIATALLWVGDTLLAATISRGILMLSPKGEVIGGIPPAAIRGGGPVSRMVMYDNMVYARADRSIVAIDPRSWSVSTVNTSFLATNDPLSDFIIRDGRFYVASGSRVIRADFSTDWGTSAMPPLLIEKLWANDEEVRVSDRIRLPYDHNSIRLTYTVPWFGDLRNLSVEYRVNDSEWRQNDPMSRQLNLPYLSPGGYRVELRAVLPDGRITPLTSVLLDIIAPVWARWWFIVLCLVLFSVGIYSLYRYRLMLMGRQGALVQEKLKLEQELERSMLTSIRSQMNPHFIFNALNTIQSYIYLNDKPNAINYLGKFSSLTRKVLEMSAQELVTVAEEVETLRLYLELEQMRFADSMDVEVTVDPDIKGDIGRIPPMLIQPYVENAIKHGLLHKKDDRMLRLDFRADKGSLLVTIEDNGVGRRRSEELSRRGKAHRPFSSEANRKRLEIMNRATAPGFTVEYQDLEDEAGKPLGTRVVLRMPMM